MFRVVSGRKIMYSVMDSKENRREIRFFPEKFL
jgi:hypothetical protein